MRATLWILKFAALSICVVLALQGKPPADAQAQTVQDAEISGLNSHLSHTDGVVDADEKRLRDIELQMSEMQGEERAAFIFLSLLTGGSLVLQVKVKRKEA
jgi:hypothetical protein